jgi:hypothetical protein
MSLTISVEVLFSPRLKDLLEEGKPNGIEFTILPVRMQRSLDFEPIANIVINFASNVSAGLFVLWLLPKLPEKVRKKITIGSRETRWDEGEIRRIIAEELKKASDGDPQDKKDGPKD